MAKKYILTHDLGTRSDKAALFGNKLNLIFQTTKKYPLYQPKKGWAEQDADDWWQAVIETTREIFSGSKVDPEEIAAVIFDCQMNCTVPIESDGNALMRSINWLDTRAAKVTEKYTKGLLKLSGYNLRKLLMFLRITGGAPGATGKDPISHLIWIKEEMPEIYDQTFKFLSVKDFIIYKCTKNAVTSRDLGNTTWLMNTMPNKFHWSKKILKVFDIDEGKLPEIKKSTEIAGELTTDAAQELGLNQGTPVFVGSGDIAAAAIGSGSILENEIHICLGTADWVGAHSSKRKRYLTRYIGAICSAKDDYLVLSKQETGAACLDWVNEVIFKDLNEKYKDNQSALYKELDSIADSAQPGSNNLIFIPWMFGERSPLNDPNARAGFLNIGLNHQRPDLLRSVYEGTALNIRWGLEYVEKLVGEADHINFIGGGANSDVWCQIIADTCQVSINKMVNPDLGSARGSCIIAMVGLNILNKFSDAVKLIKIDKKFSPNAKNKKVYDNLYEEFTKFYKHNKILFKNLNY
jgi:xylulokinase